jgi:hypothetical protein
MKAKKMQETRADKKIGLSDKIDYPANLERRDHPDRRQILIQITSFITKRIKISS